MTSRLFPQPTLNTTAKHRQTLPIQTLSNQTLPIQTLSNQTLPSQTLSNQTIPIQTLSNQTLPIQTLSNQTLPIQTLSNQTLPIQTLSNQTLPIQTLSNQTLPIQTLSNQTLPIQTLSNQTLPIQTLSNQTLPIQTLSNQTLPIQTLSNQTLPIQTLSNQTLPIQTLSNQTLPIQTLSNQTLPIQTLSNQTLPIQTLSNQTLPIQTLSNQTLPIQTLSNQTLPIQTLSNQTLPIQTLSNQTLPIQTLSNQTLPIQTLSNQTLPIQTLSNQTRPIQTLSNQTRPIQTLSNQTLPIQTLSNQTLPIQTLSNQTLPIQTLSNQTLPIQTLSNQTLPIQTLSNQTLVTRKCSSQLNEIAFSGLRLLAHHRLLLDAEHLEDQRRYDSITAHLQCDHDPQRRAHVRLALESAGMMLRKLRIMDVARGLYGRELVTLGRTRGKQIHHTQQLQQHGTIGSHAFGPRDVVDVEIEGGQNNVREVYEATIYRVNDDTITIVVNEEHGKEKGNTNVWEVTHRHNITVHKKPDEVTYRRYQNAVDTVTRLLAGRASTQHRAEKIMKLLYSENQQPQFAPNTVEWQAETTGLNEQQRQAVQRALTSMDVHLVHGPPGTGKTATLVELIKILVDRKQRVLACASSNVAVDNLVERMVKRGIRCVRSGHPARIMEEVLSVSIDSVIQRSDEAKVCNGIREEMLLKQRAAVKSKEKSERHTIHGELRELRKELKQRERRAVSATFTNTPVLCCTLTGAASRDVQAQQFDVVIIDEAAQSLEVACLIASQLGSKLVLAGDHRQLPPVVKSQEAVNGGLGTTLFDRLITQYGDCISTLLATQYRMHKVIMQWSSDALYDGKLIASSDVAEHLLSDLNDVASNVLTQSPFVLIDTAGCNMNEADASSDNLLQSVFTESKCNFIEADIAKKYVTHLVESGVAPAAIAVITPYNAQVGLIRDKLRDLFPGIEIGTVDGLQGREKEAVVISMVRSNMEKEVGFLSEHRRMNVAVTRARRHVCIIADSETVSSDSFLRQLIDYAQMHAECFNAEEFQSLTAHELLKLQILAPDSSSIDLSNNLNGFPSSPISKPSDSTKVTSLKPRMSKAAKRASRRRCKQDVVISTESSCAEYKICDQNDTEPYACCFEPNKPKLTQTLPDSSSYDNLVKHPDRANANKQIVQPLSKHLQRFAALDVEDFDENCEKKDIDDSKQIDYSEQPRPLQRHVAEPSMADDFDDILSEFAVKCNFGNCSQKLSFGGMDCRYCHQIYCSLHFSPFVHGCEQRYGEAVRASMRRQNEHAKAPFATARQASSSHEKAALKMRLERKMQKLAHKSAKKL